MKYILAPLLYLSIAYSMDESTLAFRKEAEQRINQFNQQLRETKDKDALFKSLKKTEKKRCFETMMDIGRLEHEANNHFETGKTLSKFTAQIKDDFAKKTKYTQFFHEEDFKYIDPNSCISQIKSKYTFVQDDSITLTVEGSLSSSVEYNAKIEDDIINGYKECSLQKHVELFQNTHLTLQKAKAVVDPDKKTIELRFKIKNPKTYKNEFRHALKKSKNNYFLHIYLLRCLKEAQDKSIDTSEESPSFYEFIKEINKGN